YPLSNLRLGSGIASILKYRQAGVNVAFGCDGAASNDSQDLLEAVKIGTILHNVTDLDYRHWIRPSESIQMAALGGVTGLNMAQELGTIEVGKQADLVLYDLTNLSLLPQTNPIGLLVLGRPTNAVQEVWVKGDRIISEGKPTRINLDNLRQQFLEASHWQTQLDLPTLKQLEKEYRQAMELSLE
ncbi:MAG: amidohydrolase family protein, partial [Chroococcales cyanobacterium]